MADAGEGAAGACAAFKVLGSLMTAVRRFVAALFLFILHHFQTALKRLRGNAPEMKSSLSIDDSDSDECDDDCVSDEDSSDDAKGWVRARPALRGFVIELQLKDAEDDWVAVKPDAKEPMAFENDFFKGHMLFMLATDPEDETHSGHMAGKPRRFEMQVQGLLKQTPRDKMLHMGAELGERPKLSLITTTLVRTVMAFVKRRTAGLEWSLGSSRHSDSPEDRPYCAFPLITGVDQLVVTRENHPTLGHRLPETDAMRVHRRSAAEQTLEADGSTYSFAFYSSFVDFSSWCVSIPQVGSPPLENMVGDQPMFVVVYDHDAKGKRRYWMRYRLRWDAGLDALAAETLQRRAERKASSRRLRRASKEKVDDSKHLTTATFVAVSVSLADGRRGPDGASVTPPADGASVTPQARLRRSSSASCAHGLSDSRGYAVLRETATAAVVQLVRESPTGAADGWRSAVRDGDVVRVQLASNRAWLTIVRGHWLAWKPRADAPLHAQPHASNEPPRARASELFIVDVCGGGFVAYGAEFTLRSHRWLEVSVSVGENRVSAKYGGRLLRLRRCGDDAAALNFTANKLQEEGRPVEVAVQDASEVELRPPKRHSERTISKTALIHSVGVAGWVELVDRAAMRATRAYLLVIDFAEESAEDETAPRRTLTRLCTGAELALALSVHPAELAVGRGGRSDQGALRTARRTAARDDRRARRAAAQRARAAHRAARDLAAAATAARDAAHRARGFASEGAMALSNAALQVKVATLGSSANDRPRLGRVIGALTGRGRGGDKAPSEKAPALIDVNAATDATDDDASGSQSDSSDDPFGAGLSKVRRAAALREFDDEGDESPGDATEGGSTGSTDSEDDAEAHVPVFQSRSGSSSDFAPEHSPWLRASVETVERPPYHRSSADITVHLVKRRLTALVEAAKLERYGKADSRVRDLVSKPSALEDSFLRGGAAELGVKLNVGRLAALAHFAAAPATYGSDTDLAARMSNPEGSAVVARALGEGHWAEQLAVLRGGRLDVLEPLSSAASAAVLALPLHEIISVRTLATRGDDEAMSQTMPFATLVVETVGLCHYMGFATEEKRTRWAAALTLARNCAADPEAVAPALRDPRDAFVLKPPAYKGDRLILNARRFAFDVCDPRGALTSQPHLQLQPWELSVALLRRAYSLTPDADAAEMATLFDSVAQLRALPLEALTNESPAGALCFFLNLHHALLQHALLVLGAPRRPSEIHAFSTAVSYDCLGDVFSLSELSHCVVRGRLHEALKGINPLEHDDDDAEDLHDEQDAPAVRMSGFASAGSLAAFASAGSRFRDRTERLRAGLRGASTAPAVAQATTPPPASPPRATARSPPRSPLPSMAAPSTISPRAALKPRGKGARQWGWPQPAPPREGDEHWELALAAADCRVALALNQGSLDYPSSVNEFTPAGLAHQLNDAATRFLELPHSIIIDEQRRMVTLPAACELLRADLTDNRRVAIVPSDDDARDVLKTCLRFVGKRRWRQLSALLLPEAPCITVKFRRPAAKMHDSLNLHRLAEPAQRPEPPRTPTAEKPS